MSRDLAGQLPISAGPLSEIMMMEKFEFQDDLGEDRAMSYEKLKRRHGSLSGD